MADNDNLELLLAVCAVMQETGLVTSKAEFSTRVLRRSPSYLTSMRSRNRHVDDCTITDMKKVIENWIKNPDPNQPCPISDLLPIYMMIWAYESRRSPPAASVTGKGGWLRPEAASRWWDRAGTQIRARMRER